MIALAAEKRMGAVVASGPCYVRGMLPPTDEIEIVTDEVRLYHAERESER